MAEEVLEELSDVEVSVDREVVPEVDLEVEEVDLMVVEEEDLEAPGVEEVDVEVEADSKKLTFLIYEIRLRNVVLHNFSIAL